MKSSSKVIETVNDDDLSNILLNACELIGEIHRNETTIESNICAQKIQEALFWRMTDISEKLKKGEENED